MASNSQHGALVEAARKGTVKKVKKLLTAGVPAQGSDETQAQERPPVLYAILADEPEVVSLLLDAGESANRQVNGHQTVFTSDPAMFKRFRHVRDLPKNDRYEVFHEGSLLHVAAVAGSVDCAKILLDAGADPLAADSEGRTPAMLATMGGKVTAGVLKLLPEPDLSSETARLDLMTRALHDGDVIAAQTAVDHGFDVSSSIKTHYNVCWTPITFAAIQGNVELLQILLNAGADINQTDWTESKKPVFSGIRYLYENGGLDCFSSSATPINRTAVSWAAFYGNVDALRQLVQSGADLSLPDALPMTALHAAALNNQPEAIAALVASKVDLHAEAFDKMTPLHVAAEANSIQAVKKLLELGADPTRLNSRNESPYLAAKEWGKPGAYRLLEPHTPAELRKKKRKPKAPAPSLVGSTSERKKILSKAKKQFGPAAKKLTSKSFHNRLAKAASAESFLGAVELVRKKLKAGESGQWEEVPEMRWFENVKITDARLLKLQAEFLDQGIFLARELLRQDGLCRVYVLPTNDVFEVFGAFRTNGANFEIYENDMMAWLMDLHARHPFRLVSVAHDGLEPKLETTPAEPDELIRELLTVCPPEDDEQISVKWLRKRLKSKTPQPFMWWD